MSGNAQADQDDATAAAFDTFVKQQVKSGKYVFTLGGEGLDVEVIPTGAISLDVALTVGGLPRGRIVELYGPEMSGKTSLALSCAAEAQKLGLKVGFVDAEHALARDHAVSMGVAIDQIAVFQPDSGEEGLEMVRQMCASGAFGLVIVDSTAALTPQAEIDGEIGDQHMGLQARMMSQALRILNGVVQQSNTTVIFINQLREKIGGYGNPETTPGGRALKFYSSVRIDVRSPASAKLEEGTGKAKVVIGQEVRTKVTKNKVGPPHKTAVFDLIFGQGIAQGSALLECARELGLIEVNGASYVDVATGERIEIGKDKVVAVIESDPELAQRLTDNVYAILRGDAITAPAPAEDADEDVEDESVTAA